MTATEWALANKVKTGLGVVAALAAVVVLPVSFVAWAEGQTAEQIREAELIQQGRVEAAATVQAQAAATQAAKHDYDFYDIRAAIAEQELVDLEQDVDDGVQLTASQGRKMRRLETEVESFNNKKLEALEDLAEVETEDETE
jgi:hypothetical protein